MAQAEYNFFWQGTSTGGVLLKSAPAILHTIVIGSTGVGVVYQLFNATSSAAATASVASLVNPTPNTYMYDIVCPSGLFLGQTSSTADCTVTWA
jgi:hypothetical protein